MKNFLTYSSAKAQLKYLGNTLVQDRAAAHVLAERAVRL